MNQEKPEQALADGVVVQQAEIVEDRTSFLIEMAGEAPRGRKCCRDQNRQRQLSLGPPGR